MPFETAFEQWQEGLERLEAAPFDERPIARAGHAQGRMRSCAAGSAARSPPTELAELYDAGTGWVSDIAVAVAPDAPFAWDVRIVGDAAFGRYVRGAVDFSGGRLNR